MQEAEHTALVERYRQHLRGDFRSFIAKTFASVSPGVRYLHNWHIDLIAEYLEAARRREVRRLIINLPPRYLKSVCVSVAWTAWLLGRRPEERIIAASYSSALALKHALDTRQVMSEAWYRAVFPEVKFAPDQNEKHKFMTTARGYRFATSVGGTLTGEGGNILILDDPLNAAQAQAKTYREEVNRWYEHSFASRLDDKKNGVIVLVMQRLHAEDLSGYLLARGGWEHVMLPAITPEDAVYDFGRVRRTRAEGELLHEAREGHEEIARMKLEMGGSAFAAQYQQQPAPPEGAMIKAKWLARYEAQPATFTRIVQSWDTAIKAGDGNDASACITFGEWENDAYIIDACVLRKEYPALRREVIAHATRWKADVILMEDKASGQQLLQDLRNEEKLPPLIPCMPRGDKIMRLAAVTPALEAGRVRFPARAEWLTALEHELLQFPSGKYDDQVDAFSQYLQWRRAHAAGKPVIRRL